MPSKNSFVCDACEKFVNGKPKHKLRIFGDDGSSYSRWYCSDECLGKSGDFTV